MQITSFSIFRYKLPLTAPLKFPLRMLYRREGLLLRMASDAGNVGWGEVAPLPGFSRERLQEATRQAFKLKRVMTGRPMGDDGLGPVQAEELQDMTLLPSVCFGFELAVWNLRAETAEKTLPTFMAEAPRSTVTLGGLLEGDPEVVIEEARQMRENGYRAVKLKVGQRTVDEDAELVCTVADILGGGVRLRLDANQAWDLDEALAFTEKIDGTRYEYLEEPLFQPEELPAFVKQSGVPVALDESMVDIPAEELAEHGAYAKAVVLKPTILGGLRHAMDLVERAQKAGLTPVLSSAFEAGIGTMGLVALAACVGDEGVPVGLDTYRRLEQDVVRPRLKLDRGQVDVPPMMGAKRTMNGHMLREV